MKSLALNASKQNSSTEHSKGVRISKDNDKNKTQIDISRSQQVDSSGNQNQATD